MYGATDASPQGAAALVEVDGQPVGRALLVVVHQDHHELFLERLDALANTFFTEVVSPLGPDDGGTPVGTVTLTLVDSGQTIRLTNAAVLYVSSGLAEVRLRGDTLEIERPSAATTPAP